MIFLRDGGRRYPDYTPISKPYLWRTSAVDRKLNNYYREEFIIDEKLRKRKQNLDIYKSKPMEICSDKHRGKLAIGHNRHGYAGSADAGER